MGKAPHMCISLIVCLDNCSLETGECQQSMWPGWMVEWTGHWWRATFWLQPVWPSIIQHADSIGPTWRPTRWKQWSLMDQTGSWWSISATVSIAVKLFFSLLLIVPLSITFVRQKHNRIYCYIKGVLTYSGLDFQYSHCSLFMLWHTQATPNQMELLYNPEAPCICKCETIMY